MDGIRKSEGNEEVSWMHCVLSRALYCRTPEKTPAFRASIVVDRLNQIIAGGQLRHKKSGELHVCDVSEVQLAKQWIESGNRTWRYTDTRSGLPFTVDLSVPLLTGKIDALVLTYSSGGILVRVLATHSSSRPPMSPTEACPDSTDCGAEKTAREWFKNRRIGATH